MPLTTLPSARRAAATPAAASPAARSPAGGSPVTRSPAAGYLAATPSPAVASWPALGITVAVAVTDPMRLPAASELVAAELAAVDAACSTFRGDSELAAVNAAGRRGGGPVRISPLLADAIGAALRAAELTGGDVDPVAGPGMLRVSRTPAAGQTSCEVNRVTGPGMFRASSAQATGQAGGDSGIGAGPASTVSGRPAAALPAAPVAVVSIQHGGLATAGAGAGRWHRAGDVLAHVLRPRGISLPSAPWRLASVSAASCLEARAASVAAIVMGNDAVGWLAGLGVAARLVDAAGQVRTVGGWPADGAVPSGAPAAVIPASRPAAAVIPISHARATVIPTGRPPAAVIPASRPAVAVIAIGGTHGAAAACPSDSGSGGSGEAAGR